jgi:hypothetical protein
MTPLPRTLNSSRLSDGGAVKAVRLNEAHWLTARPYLRHALAWARVPRVEAMLRSDAAAGHANACGDFPGAQAARLCRLRRSERGSHSLQHLVSCCRVMRSLWLPTATPSPTVRSAH